MRKKKRESVLLIFIFIFILGLLLWYLPMQNDKECQERVFEDLKDKVNDSLSSVVGIIPESEEGLKNHYGLSSGVIFDKKDNIYYLITAKHVIENTNYNYKIFTIDTKFSGEIINTDSNVTFEIPDESYYESLIPAKIEYISDTSDLAILSFEYTGDLKVIDFEKNNISINDRIVVIGHPEGERYHVTYGFIKSDITELDENNNEKIIKHNAYMKQGNSGGIALNENMKLVGMNIRGFFNLFGYYDVGYMIPSSIIEENINLWRNK